MRWNLAICLLFLLPSPALGAPPVRFGSGGEVWVGPRLLGRIQPVSRPHKFRLESLTAAGRALTHLEITGSKGDRVEILAEAGKSGRTLFAGATGSLGVDGEWRQHLRVDASGVLLYQTRADARRCDGQPVYLFPRRYDFTAGRFRPVSARVTAGGGAPVIQASRTPALAPAAEPMNTFKATFASSQLGDEGSAGNLTRPVELDDGDPATAWAESLGGDGRGEVIIARAPHGHHALRALRILPGDASSPRAFRRANRLRSALLILSAEHRYRVTWAADPAAARGKEREPYWIQLPRPVKTRCVTLVLDQVFPGTLARGGSGGRTAVSELTLFTELAFGGGGEQLLADLRGEDQEVRRAATATLARMGDRGVSLVNGTLQSEDPGRHERAAWVLMASPAASALAPLVRLLPSLSRPTRSLALDALERGGERTVSALRQVLPRAPDQVADLAPLLGRIGGSAARDLLISLAGRGAEAQRAAVAEGLIRLHGAGDLDAAISAAESAGEDLVRADLVLAVGRMPAASARGAELARRIAAFWKDEAPFELRYRILNALGKLDAEGQRALLEAAVGQQDPALRLAAVDALRRADGPGPAPTLLRALGDGDPRVRASAAMGLSNRALDPAQRSALVARMKVERWGLVAGQLAEALGGHCSGPVVATLRETTRHGPRGYAVDRRALESMVRCKPGGMGKFLLAMAQDGRWRTGMRTQALALIGPDLGAPLTSRLVALFDQLRRRAMRRESDEQVAVAMAGTLGNLGGAAAADALAGALALEPIPTIRLAAALALGRVCRPETRATLAQASRDAPSRVMQAARDSLRRCGWSASNKK